MYRIVRKKMLSDSVAEFRVEAPLVAAKARPGHFVIVRNGEKGERIPLTIADWDEDAGTIDIVVQAVGRTTSELIRFDMGDGITDLAGPLGNPAPIEKVGLVVCVAGGIGAAPVYPQAREYRRLGCRVISILGARTGALLTWEDRLAEVSDEIILCTEDGTKGLKGLVTAPLKDIIEQRERPDRVLAIGPMGMMRAVSETTRPYGIPTFVSLNSLMVDGTGMCGGCRVTVSGESKFACVDGPDFDGHQVDFAELMNRQGAYRDHERRAVEAASSAREGCQCGRHE